MMTQYRGHRYCGGEFALTRDSWRDDGQSEPAYAGQYGSTCENAIVGRGGRVAMPEASNGCDCTVDWWSTDVAARRSDHRFRVRRHGLRLDPEYDPGSGKFPVAGSLDLSPDQLELLRLPIIVGHTDRTGGSGRWAG